MSASAKAKARRTAAKKQTAGPAGKARVPAFRQAAAAAKNGKVAPGAGSGSSAPAPGSIQLTLTIPAGPLRPRQTFRPRHVEVALNSPQAETLAVLGTRLDEGNRRLRNGVVVQSGASVVRWLLEQVGEALEVQQPGALGELGGGAGGRTG